MREAARSGERPLASCLELAEMLCAQERQAEALRILAACADRVGEASELDIAMAGVLRDLGRRDDALDILLALRDRVPSRIGPTEAFEIAELCCLCGRHATGVAILEHIESTVEGDSYRKARLDEFESLARSLASGQPVRTMRMRDVLADLRSAKDPERRIAMLRLICEQGDAAREAGCRISVGDQDPRVRAYAVRKAVVPESALAEFCAMALSDPSAEVRTAGAERAESLTTGERLPLLIPALAAEASAEAFAAIDSRVCSAMGIRHATSAVEAADSALRRQVAEDRRRAAER